MRCVVCGRLPSEVCCGRCHWVHDTLWETVNTEAVNQ